MSRDQSCVWLDPAFSQMPEQDFAEHFLRTKRTRHLRLPDATDADVASAQEIMSGRYTVNGETHNLDARSVQWHTSPSRDKEWLIALHKHYFALDLVQAYRKTKRVEFLSLWIDLMQSWLDHTSPSCLSYSDAHVDAKRIEHWITVYLLLRDADASHEVPGAFLRSYLERLHADADYVSRNLRAARNHRTFQLYAMFLTGAVFPEFRISGRLLHDGRDLLIDNLMRDFAPSGVHVERSTHYHNITLETALAFVRLAEANGIPLPADLYERLREALTFSAYMQFPDGEIPLINDSDNGCHAQMLADGACLMTEPAFAWAASRGKQGGPFDQPSKVFDGYYVLSDGWGRDPDTFATRQHVFFDCAPLGEGSHSHYDLFNLCWFASGKQILVDPGRYTYNAEPGEHGLDWRREFKSTRFHNTVEIDGRDQTRYLSKAALPPVGIERLDKTRHKQKHGPEIELLSCMHHFGQRSDWVRAAARSHEYTPVHTRILLFVCRQYLVISDVIEIHDGDEHTAALRFHLSQSAGRNVKLSSENSAFGVAGDGFRMRILAPAGAAAEIVDGWISKTYGIKEPAPVVEVRCRSATGMTFYSVLMPTEAAGETCQLREAAFNDGVLRIDLQMGDTVYCDEISGIECGGAIQIRRRDQQGVLAYIGGPPGNQAAWDVDAWA